jgi:SAM-dependent methyltransferase
MQAREYWNENLDTDNLSRHGGAAHERLDESLDFANTPEFAWLQKRVGPVADRLVVDVGGGIGLHAVLWARAGARVLVVDIAVERLRLLRDLVQRAGVADRVMVLAGNAESLPLRSDAVDVVFTKSVLIHTQLSEATDEIYRVLRVGGHGAFIEPLDRNPIIGLYRRLFAPKIWKSITRYFDSESLETLRVRFGRLRWKPFYLLSAGSFFWQYGWKDLGRFRRSLKRWMHADAWIAKRFPRLEPWAWFAAIEVSKDSEK